MPTNFKLLRRSLHGGNTFKRKGIWIFLTVHISAALKCEEGLSAFALRGLLQSEGSQSGQSRGCSASPVPTSWMSVPQAPSFPSLGLFTSPLHGRMVAFSLLCSLHLGQVKPHPHRQPLLSVQLVLVYFSRLPQHPRFRMNHTPPGDFFFFCCCINLVILLFIQLFGKHKNGCFKCPKARSKPCVA